MKKNIQATATMPAGTLTLDPAPDLRALLYSLHAVRDGDFSVRLPGDWTGLEGKIADTFNEMVTANQKMAEELRRVGQVVGKEGKTRERTRFNLSKGAWGEMEVSVNTLIDDLLRPTTEVTRTIAAVAEGNLTQTVRLDVDGRPLEGEFLRSATIVNTIRYGLTPASRQDDFRLIDALFDTPLALLKATQGAITKTPNLG
ncbi:MAG: hypothetical protein BroJett011_52230 [Chloroflexota bacterium]|nr:MAG: hypothetical protein BroJett011_52230 [Chloroflexota bacterium]